MDTPLFIQIPLIRIFIRQLAQQRKEFAVGVVLETIQAEQDLTCARLDYLKAVADFKKGKTKAADAIKGAVMRETKGMAKTELVQRLLMEELMGSA